MSIHFARIKNMTTEEIVDTEIFESQRLYEAFVKSQPIINNMLKETGWNKNDCEIRLCRRCNNGEEEEWLC